MALILFDVCTPAPLRKLLPGHRIDTAIERGWRTIRNGELLDLAQDAGYDTVITADGSMPSQQNIAKRNIAVVVLRNGSRWPGPALHADEIAEAINNTKPGQVTEVECRSRGTEQHPVGLGSARNHAEVAAEWKGPRANPNDRPREATGEGNEGAAEKGTAQGVRVQGPYANAVYENTPEGQKRLRETIEQRERTQRRGKSKT